MDLALCQNMFSPCCLPVDGFKYYILCLVLCSVRNNPVGYFYANCKFGLKTKSCHVGRIRELAISGLFLSLWEDFTPVGFLAEVRLEDDLSLNFIGGIEGNQYRNTALIKTDNSFIPRQCAFSIRLAQFKTFKKRLLLNNKFIYAMCCFNMQIQLRKKIQ